MYSSLYLEAFTGEFLEFLEWNKVKKNHINLTAIYSFSFVAFHTLSVLMVASLGDKACCHINSCWRQAAPLTLFLLTVICGICLSIFSICCVVLLHTVDVAILTDTFVLHFPLDYHVNLLTPLPNLISQKMKLWRWTEKYCDHWALVMDSKLVCFLKAKKCWQWINPKHDMFLSKYCSSELPLGFQEPNMWIREK